MIGRSVKVKFVLFIVIGVLAVGFTAVRYAGLGNEIGAGRYTVTAELATGGGIFPNAEVTYRGSPVGRVGSVSLSDNGIRVQLEIDSDAPKIPASARAIVTDRSAIGEQYVDLVPDNDSPPYLRDGSRIAERKTDVPVAPARMLDAVDKLVNDVPTGSLRTVVDELGTAFDGSGQDLRTLIDAANSFVGTADEYVPQTKKLLHTGGTVLDTQSQLTGQLSTFSNGLRDITAQLKKSDPDIRKITHEAPQVTGEVQNFLHRSGNGLSAVLANLLTTSQLLESRVPAVRQLLVGLPMIGGVSPTLSRGNQGQLSFQLSFYQPPACTKGYQATKQHAGTDMGNYNPNQAAYCAEPKGSPILVRGAQNAPYGGAPPKPAAPAQLPGGMPGVIGEVSGSGGPDSVEQLYGLQK